jgi:hypothetical protein
MATTEHTINDAIAGLLRQTRGVWRTDNVVSSENTGMLVGNNKRPDILILEPSVSPVAIETEVLPATTVELDATSRLGELVRPTGRPILSSIAIRLPERFKKRSGASLDKELKGTTDLEMALCTGSNPEEYSRWPHSGWLNGAISDLSLLAQSASVPPAIIEKAADQLVEGVSEAAGLISEMVHSHPGALQEICKQLRQHDDEQTRRMAATILANAFVFQHSLARGPGQLSQVLSIDELRGSATLTKFTILNEWQKILKVNYWPIFDIARRILNLVPTEDAKLIIERLCATADKLVESRLMHSHDLTGAVFQKLIADRKFLAAYYTTPASAALLVGLAITPESPPAHGSWANPDDIRTLRIADFACGTGTILSTAYQRVGQLHELCGGDSEALHPDMMAHSLIGCDVLPAAAHLTASMISGAHPTVKYTQSSIMTVAYGKQPNGAVALGSLDLLDPQRKLEILDITARAVEGMGESERETWSALPNESFDVVIMNPPFTRATVHEADRLNVPNPMFAAFASTAEEQRLMGDATKGLTAGTSAHGNAGEASIFLVLADRKLKLDGTLALVMPLSLMSGKSWEDSRLLLANNYGDLVLVTIADPATEGMSFSADTGMGECLVVARKSKAGSKRATFVVLNWRPAYPLLGASAAKQIHRLIEGKNLRGLEDGPMGGTPLYFGEDVIGQAMDAPLPASGGWNVARIADLSLAQAAYQLANEKRVWLPTMNISDATCIPIAAVGEIGAMGPIDRDINGRTPQGGIRGPFDIAQLLPNRVPTYPVLWSHDADRERTMAFDADCEGIPRAGSTAAERAALALKVESVWSTASHCHFNRDFRFNSQSTGMQFTPRKTIGGRAWLSIRLSSPEREKALVLWANTSLGILVRWWLSNRPQSGRGTITKSALPTLPVLDVTALDPDQLKAAVRIFDEFNDANLLPVHELDKDPTRQKLDTRLALEVLGLPVSFVQTGGPLDLTRMKLAQEPSIRGGKGTADEDEGE